MALEGVRVLTSVAGDLNAPTRTWSEDAVNAVTVKRGWEDQACESVQDREHHRSSQQTRTLTSAMNSVLRCAAQQPVRHPGPDD